MSISVNNGNTPTTADGSPVDTDNPQPVEIPPLVSVNNSTAVPLAGDGVFTGVADQSNGWGIVYVNVFTDQISAVDGLKVEQSSDGTNWDHCDEYNVPASTGKNYAFNCYAKWFRVVYTNGATIQGAFRLQTLFKANGLASSHRIQDSIVDEDDARLVKAVITGKNPQDVFVNFQATTAGNFKVSLEELENAISVNGNTQLRITPFHEDGTEGNLISGVAKGAGKDGIDASTNTLQSINYEHHEIHSGAHFFVCDYIAATNGQVIDFTNTTPDTTKQIHLTYSFQGTGALSFEIWEGAVIDVAGAAVTPQNNNRNSVNTSDSVLALGDTFTSEGVMIYKQYSGANKQAGFIERSREIILNRNTVYIFRITNETTLANVIDFCAEWYEHTPKG